MAPRENPQDEIIPRLVADGLITEDDLERARRAAASGTDRGVVYQLVRLGLIETRRLVLLLADMFRVRGIDLASVKIDDEMLRALPREDILAFGVIPVSRQGNKLYVAMADPNDLETLDRLRFITKGQIVAVVADSFSIDQFLERRFATQTEQIEDFLAELSDEDLPELEIVDDDEDIAQLAANEEVEAAPVVKLVNRLLVEAVERGASDVHFEFYEHQTRIRYRIDGALIEFATPPKKWDRAIISRLKIISRLNIGERRVPQDGRTKLRVGKRVVDFRVSTLPTSFGEKVVLRILDKSVLALDLDTLGMEGREKEVIERTITTPYGMLLVTGPTGSGKTTTLYSILARMNKDDVNILTVEDPIEYDLPGINQVPVRPEIGLDFARALRAFLRQDPDIIMVGEIRDEDTADIAVRSALTGHLVLSTLHTNDSASTITRLTEMGVERFNLSSALIAIVAQRLVRRICPSCKIAAEVTEAQIRGANLTREEAARIEFRRGAGCAECDSTGYRGRIGLFEVLPVNGDIAEMIIAGSSASEIKQRAIRDGMQTLRSAGMRKVREGQTTIDEVIRHTGV